MKGLSIGPMDTLIAAQALSIEGTLVTNNIKAFSRVPKLKLENWFEAI
jgi:tRNA(fMet)-specific endonuclease VapC